MFTCMIIIQAKSLANAVIFSIFTIIKGQISQHEIFEPHECYNNSGKMLMSQEVPALI
jgi:hypothetical protein